MDRFPRLFTHCMKQDISVRQAVHSGLEGAFVNRLSRQAHLELVELNEVLDSVELTDQPDRRLSPFSKTKDKLDTSVIYRMLKARDQVDSQTATFIWKNAAPPRVQMFLWLLTRGRIQCRANLFRKKIVDSPNCLHCPNLEETADHIIFNCPFAMQFWNALGFQGDSNFQTSLLYLVQCPTQLPKEQFNAFISLCCWNLWKRRNGVVFREELLSLRATLISCKSEALQWRHRMPRKSKKIIDSWCTLFDAAIHATPAAQAL